MKRQSLQFTKCFRFLPNGPVGALVGGAAAAAAVTVIAIPFSSHHIFEFRVSSIDCSLFLFSPSLLSASSLCLFMFIQSSISVADSKLRVCCYVLFYILDVTLFKCK